MDLALYLKAVVLGIVEGLTEFLPISSTGHLIIAGQLLNFHDEKAKVFEIVIQSGAMLAIVWEYRVRFWEVLTGLARADDRDARVGGRVGKAWGAVGVLSSNRSRRFIVNLAVAFMPAAILGLAFGKLIKSHLFHAVPVALAFIVGGIIILWVERTLRRGARVDSVDDMSWHDALKVGFAQAFALVPGTSRAGATIIGGMLFGLSRRAATEFSFFLAVPTLMAAGAYDLYKNRALLSAGDVGIFSVGFGVSFVSAFFCVRWLIRYISRHDFSVFAWYRIAFGAIVLATAYYGLVDWAG